MPAEKLQEGIEAEVAKAQSQLARGADPEEVLEAFSRSLMNKLLHPAIEALKQSG